MTAEKVERDSVAELLRAFERQLLELGVELVKAVLDAQVDVVERAAVHDAVLDLIGGYVGIGDAAAAVAVGGRAASADAERRRLQVAFLARSLEVGVKGIDADQRIV